MRIPYSFRSWREKGKEEEKLYSHSLKQSREIRESSSC